MTLPGRGAAKEGLANTPVNTHRGSNQQWEAVLKARTLQRDGRVLSVSGIYPKKHSGLWESTKHMSEVLRTGELTKSEIKKEKARQTRGAQGNSTTTGSVTLTS